MGTDAFTWNIAWYDFASVPLAVGQYAVFCELLGGNAPKLQSFRGEPALATLRGQLSGRLVDDRYVNGGYADGAIMDCAYFADKAERAHG
jgi:hypothetical protein